MEEVGALLSGIQVDKVLVFAGITYPLVINRYDKETKLSDSGTKYYIPYV